MPAIIVLVLAAFVALAVLGFALHVLFSPWLLVAIAIVAFIKFRPRRSRQYGGPASAGNCRRRRRAGGVPSAAWPSGHRVRHGLLVTNMTSRAAQIDTSGALRPRPGLRDPGRPRGVQAPLDPAPGQTGRTPILPITVEP